MKRANVAERPESIGDGLRGTAGPDLLPRHRKENIGKRRTAFGLVGMAALLLLTSFEATAEPSDGSIPSRDVQAHEHLQSFESFEDASRDGGLGRQAIIKLDDFEDPAWPDTNLWKPLTERAPTWWPSRCRARTGSRALWAFGGRIGDIEQPCGAGAPLGTVSGIVQRLDLRAASEASQLELYFDLWLQMPPGVGEGEGEGAGFFIFLRVPDDSEPSRVPIFGVTGVGGEWVYPSRRLDLMNLADIANPREVYDLRGREWELEWVAHAPRGTAAGAGIFVDDLYLVWEPDAAVPAPTRKPTGTRVPPTRRPDPSATPTRRMPSPTVDPGTPTPTQTPVSFGAIYLPRVAYELPEIEATPSREATPGPSPTSAPPSPTPTTGFATQSPIRPSPSPTPIPPPLSSASPGRAPLARMNQRRAD